MAAPMNFRPNTQGLFAYLQAAKKQVQDINDRKYPGSEIAILTGAIENLSHGMQVMARDLGYESHHPGCISIDA